MREYDKTKTFSANTNQKNVFACVRCEKMEYPNIKYQLTTTTMLIDAFIISSLFLCKMIRSNVECQHRNIEFREKVRISPTYVSGLFSFKKIKAT